MSRAGNLSVVESKHVSVVVACPADRVYAVAANLDNLPKWAAGLASSEVHRDGPDVVATSPMGEVRIRFLPRNEFGVLDHDVELPDGTVVNNPMRVLAHPEGAEVLFTVRQLQLSDEEFERDVQMVREDLARLRDLVEGVSEGVGV